MKVCLTCGSKFNSNGWSCPSCQETPITKDGFLAFEPRLSDKNKGFDPQAFEGLFKVEAESFWFRSRNRLILWAIQEYFPNAKKFLEIGCGTGFVLSAIEKTYPQMEL